MPKTAPLFTEKKPKLTAARVAEKTKRANHAGYGFARFDVESIGEVMLPTDNVR